MQTNGLTLTDLAKAENSSVRKELIVKLKDSTGLSGRTLAELTGINREIIRKNFVINGREDLANPDIHILNLDLLTYAGNLDSLHDVETNARYTFVRGDIGDVELVKKLLARLRRRAARTVPVYSYFHR